MSARIGVVTVTFNSAQVIGPFLRCVLAQTHSAFELYVIDNASSDNTLKQVESFCDPRIHIIANEKNVGVAAGNNQGIAASLAAACEYVLLINNDTEFSAELFAVLTEEIRARACDMLVPKIVYHNRPNVLWAAGGYFLKPISQTHHFGDGEADGAKYSKFRKVEYAPTTCMLIKREVFEKIGMMDENYFVYYDDTDFCLRASRARIVLGYTPATVLSHKVSSLTGADSAFSLRYKTINQVYFALKNYPPVWWPGLLLGIQIYYLGKLVRFIEPFSMYIERQRLFLEGIRFFRSVGRKERSSAAGAVA
jgi:GT2 family glycosyltransferase